jgi:hypothetical protein
LKASLFRAQLYTKTMKRMKLKWIGLKFKYPLLLHPISIGEVDEENKKKMEEEEKQQDIITERQPHRLWHMISDKQHAKINNQSKKPEHDGSSYFLLFIPSCINF